MMETAKSSEGTADSHDAVLAVPLDFTEQQRDAVRDAAVRAGFNVLRIISEPAAAVLAYQIGQTNVTDNCCVLVFRAGRQSLDWTLVDVTGGMYRVLGSHSEPRFGGHVIDSMIIEHFVGVFQREHRADCRDNKRSIGKLQSALETCKHVLSSVNTAQCSVESLYEGIDFNSPLTRSRLEALSIGFLQKCLQPLEGLLAKTSLSKADVNKVIMSGGCAKMPLLQQQVRDYFPDAEVLCSIPPDEVIAVGAANQAGILCGKNVQEVVQFSSDCELPCLSADILVGSGIDSDVVLFKAFSPIPARRQLTFRLSSGETTFCLHISERSSGSKDTALLAKIVMRNVSEGALITGVFHIRHDGSLHATCTDSENGQSQDVIIESGHHS